MKIFLIIPFFVFIHYYCFSQPVEQWTSTISDNTVVRNITTDNDNNVFVTGNYGNNSYIKKYDANGEFKWEQNISAISFFTCYLPVISTDNSGNVYTAGYVPNDSVTGTIQQIITLFKYNSDGVLVWKNLFYTDSLYPSGYISDMIVTDDAVYIAGYELDYPFLTTRSLIAKYNLTGELEWYHENDTSMNICLVLNDDGSVVTGGRINESISVEKYSITGDLIFSRLFEKGYCIDIGKDISGRIYILCNVMIEEMGNSITKIKQLDVDGDFEWEAQHDTEGEYVSEEPEQLLVNDDGNTFITGTTYFEDIDGFSSGYKPFICSFTAEGDTNFINEFSQYYTLSPLAKNEDAMNVIVYMDSSGTKINTLINYDISGIPVYSMLVDSFVTTSGHGIFAGKNDDFYIDFETAGDGYKLRKYEQEEILSLFENMEKAFTIYPNPLNNKIHIESKNDMKIDFINIYSTNGELICTISQYSENTFIIPVSGLPNGNYICLISSGNTIMSGQISIFH